MGVNVELAECAELYPFSKSVKPGTRIMGVDLQAVEKQKLRVSE